jgi:hypothetical protein
MDHGLGHSNAPRIALRIAILGICCAATASDGAADEVIMAEPLMPYVSISDRGPAEAPKVAWDESFGGITSASRGHVVGGVEFLLVRPSFSEAIAFARGELVAGALNLQGTPIAFDYEPSGRAYVGYQFADTDLALTFTYWNVSAEASIDGTVGAPNEFIVDPFGNGVDPMGFFVPGIVGDQVRTQTSVDLNVYDLDLVAPVVGASPHLTYTWTAGIRWADLDQFYRSEVLDAGVTIGQGDYHVNYSGVGPHFGFRGCRYLGRRQRLSIRGNLTGSVLVGTYDVAFSTTPAAPFAGATQSESGTRTIPVVEGELGLGLLITESFQVSGGWLFQSWWDLGTSGGTFGGLFNGADDGNIMGFDGLFLRGEIAY